MKPNQSQLFTEDIGGFRLVSETQVDHWARAKEEKARAAQQEQRL